MRAIFDSKKLQDTMRQCLGVTGGPEYVNIRCSKKGGMNVLASGNDAIISMLVPDATVEAEGEITLPVASVTGLTRGRGALLIEASGKKDSTVSINSAKGNGYKTNFVSPPFAKIEEAEEAEGKKVKFSKDVQTLLEDAVARISLNNVYTDDPIYVWVESKDKGGTIVACGDQYHFAYYEHSEVNLGKKSFSLPMSTFRTIQDLSAKNSCNLTLLDSQIYAKSSSMSLSMPLTQADDTVSPDQFRSLIDMVKKPTGWVDVSRDALLATLDNIDSVYEQNVPLELSVKKGKLNIVFKTGQTQLKEVVSINKEKWGEKLTVSCDPALLRDTLGPMKGKDVKLCVLEGTTLFVQEEAASVKTFYACSVVG